MQNKTKEYLLLAILTALSVITLDSWLKFQLRQNNLSAGIYFTAFYLGRRGGNCGRIVCFLIDLHLLRNGCLSVC